MSANGFERLFDNEFIQKTLSDAVWIVEEINPADDLRVPLLNAAIAMVGNMRQTTPSGIAIPEMQFAAKKLQ